jgi:anti-sigma B factor antagonist
MYDQSDGPWADRAARRCATWQPSRNFRKRVRGKGIRSMSLKINIRETAAAAILDMSGRVSLGDALADLRDSIREALAGDQKNILLNLAEVSYIDSSGLGQLIGSYATVTNRGGQMKLLNLQKRVNDLMQITKLLTVFETYTNEEAALRSFAKKK